jgi:hypothetical protein
MQTKPHHACRATTFGHLHAVKKLQGASLHAVVHTGTACTEQLLLQRRWSMHASTEHGSE